MGGFVRPADLASTPSSPAAPAVRLPRTRTGRTARELIDRAKAVLMARQGLTEQQAFRWLQRSAMDHRVSIRDIARVLLVSHAMPVAQTPAAHLQTIVPSSRHRGPR